MAGRLLRLSNILKASGQVSEHKYQINIQKKLVGLKLVTKFAERKKKCAPFVHLLRLLCNSGNSKIQFQ